MTSHILLDEDSEHGLRCLHCYDIHSPVLPMTVERHIDECRGFVLMHKHCVKPKEPSPQLPLPHTEATHGICTHTGIGMPGCEMCDPRHIDPPNAFADTERERPERWGEGPLLDAIELRHLVTCIRPKEFWPTVEQVESWHTDVRADVQRWCRIEHTRAHPIAGHPVPFNMDMPFVLSNIERRVPKPRKGARPLTSKRKAKP